MIGSSRRTPTSERSGLSRLDVMVAVLVVGVLVAVALPMVLHRRERARETTCRNNLRTMAMALHAYHDTYERLPPAAIWSTDATTSLALHSAKGIDLITHENWAQLLLPFAGQEALSRQFVSGRPVGDPDNATARTARLSLMTCPVDSYNREDNPYRFFPRGPEGESVEFARGNYAINGGTQNLQLDPPNTAAPRGDVPHLLMQTDPRRYALWGNGIAGINRSFALDEFANGQSTLVAFEELRAGIHSLDPRGVWALGQIGGSITWAHGVNGDDYGPNNQWPRSDDILGCRTLHETLGTETLMAERMPCVDYVDVNQQATARSLHPGGVHVAFLDGAVRFISDGIDPGLWHVMHSRETPADVLEDDFDERLKTTDDRRDAPKTDSHSRGPVSAEPLTVLENSLGMEFVLIPAGRFTMGLPDVGNNHDVPEETPPHEVRITRPFYLGRYEVMQTEYLQVMGANPSHHPQAKQAAQSGRYPVENVTWFDAKKFCRRLAEMADEKAAGRQYRLPSEAEWEYACRAGSKEPYLWRQTRKGDDNSGEAAGIHPPLPLTPVGDYRANPFGLYDMRGNVWEWCADWFDRDYYSRSPVEDPQGPAHGYLKVVRGGDWRFVGEPCKIDYRMLPPWKSNRFVGFRAVCEIEVE